MRKQAIAAKLHLSTKLLTCDVISMRTCYNSILSPWNSRAITRMRTQGVPALSRGRGPGTRLVLYIQVLSPFLFMQSLYSLRTFNFLIYLSPLPFFGCFQQVLKITLSLSKVRIFAHFQNSVKLEKYGTFDDVMSACGQFTDKKNSHAPLEVASRRLDVAVGALM